MTSRIRVSLILISALTALGETAFCQEVLWHQPYSGNVVSGPFAIESGELPNCPDCDCPACQPDGSHGFVKRLFGRFGDRMRRCRREYYFNQQMYHTGYTRPVLPPYCEPGYGYFETSWRQPIPCWTAEPYPGIPVAPETAPSDPPPTAPMPSGAETMPDPELPGNSEPQPKYENDPADPVPADPRGDEKPPYEESPPNDNDNAGVWQSMPRPAEVAYPYPSLRK